MHDDERRIDPVELSDEALDLVSGGRGWGIDPNG